VESSEGTELSTLVDNLKNRLGHQGEIELHKIGIILPLTGDKGKFGEKVLSGIDLL